MKRWIREIIGLVVAVVLVLGALVVYQGYFAPGEGQGITASSGDLYRAPQPDRYQHCRGLGGSALERANACLASTRVLALSGDAKELVRDIARKGAVLTIAQPLDLGVDERPPTPEQLAMLLSTDEEAVAASLREAGVRGIVVHRDLTQALDRDRTVLSRLTQHDHLEWFQLRRVTEYALVYTVRSSSNVVPVSTGSMLLAGLRARLEGRPVPRQTWAPKSVRLLGSVRLQGHTLVTRHASGDDLEDALSDLARKLSHRWQRRVATDGHGRLTERMDDIRLEVHVVMERAPVEPRSRWAIFDLWELGVDGMMLKRAEGLDDEKFTYMPGSEAITRSMKSADAFLLFAAKQFEWRAVRPWEDARTRLDIMRTAHFMERERGGRTGAVRLVRGMPEVGMADLTDARIQQMLIDGGEWWLTNMRADNSFNYKFWPAQNRMSTDYNEVRHILATRDLADTWRYREDPRYLSGAKRAMDWLMQYAVTSSDQPHPTLPQPPEGALLFRYPRRLGERGNKPPNQKLGTVAVALLGWVAWAETTGDHSEDDHIRAMAKFVKSRLLPSGKFDPYYVNSGHSYYKQDNDIVPGEAALALGEVAEYFDEPEWLDFYSTYLDYYEPWFQERAARKVPTGRWPAGTYTNEDRLELVQFGPWSVMANKQAYRVTGDERAAAFGLEVADWMIDNYQWSGDRAPFPDYVGGYYKIPTELPAMQTFCYSEGTAAAYHTAALFRPDAKDKYDRSTREAIRFLDVMQFDDESTYFAAEPELIHGGIKYTMSEQKVRIDYVGHGLSTLSQYLDARDADPAVQLEVEVERVEYDPAHEAIWGRWMLDPSETPLGPAQLSAEQRARWMNAVRRMRFEYTPDALIERGMGRAVRIEYDVVEVQDDGTLVIDLQPDGGAARRRQLRVNGDTMVASDDGAEQRFVRDVAVSEVPIASSAQDPEEGAPEDESGE